MEFMAWISSVRASDIIFRGGSFVLLSFLSALRVSVFFFLFLFSGSFFAPSVSLLFLRRYSKFSWKGVEFSFVKRGKKKILCEE